MGQPYLALEVGTKQVVRAAVIQGQCDTLPGLPFKVLCICRSHVHFLAQPANGAIQMAKPENGFRKEDDLLAF
eukprot:1159778-Pelagomonas_calceolata.AAC.21